jgi:hypothetical protein
VSSLRKRRRQVEKALQRLENIQAPDEALERARPALERLRTSLSDPQREVHASDARFRVVVAGRRFGKTYEALYELLDHALHHAGSLCWYVAPTFQTAKEVAWRELKRMAPSELVAETHATFMTMTLVNGSEIGLRSADNPDSLRGRGLDFVVLDESAGLLEGLPVAVVLDEVVEDGDEHRQHHLLLADVAPVFLGDRRECKGGEQRVYPLPEEPVPLPAVAVVLVGEARDAGRQFHVSNELQEAPVPGVTALGPGTHRIPPSKQLLRATVAIGRAVLWTVWVGNWLLPPWCIPWYQKLP